MKTIAIIGSCDTKYREIAYMREQVESQGVKAMVINVATGLNPSYGYDVSRDVIFHIEYKLRQPRTLITP